MQTVENSNTLNLLKTLKAPYFSRSAAIKLPPHLDNVTNVTEVGVSQLST